MRTDHFLQDDKFISRTTVDVGATINRAKAIREYDDVLNRKYVGSIPANLAYEWTIEAEQKGIWRPGESGHLLNQYFVKKLRDGDFVKLRGER